MKKIISVILLFAIFIANQSTVFAENCKIKLYFLDDFNVHKSYVRQEIPFILDEKIVDVDNEIIPAGTKFIAKVADKKESRFCFRRAYVRIVIDKLILPDGKEYAIYPVSIEKNLKSPAVLNAAKCITSSIVAAGVCIFGATIIAIECLSVGGLVLAPYTGAAVGIGIAFTSKGLNYKAKAGTPITLVLKNPIDIEMHESIPNIK